MYRAQEKENLAKLDERDAAENATLKDELRKGTGGTPCGGWRTPRGRRPRGAERARLVGGLVGTNEEGID